MLQAKLTEGSTSVVETVVTAEDGQTYANLIKRLSSSDACLFQLDHAEIIWTYDIIIIIF